MLRLSLIIVTAFFLVSCSSNQTTKDVWKLTKRQYRSYLNTPASVNLDSKGGGEEYSLALATSVRHVDAELDKLVRILENSGRNVDSDWVYTTVRRLPWLSGVALVSPKGEVISHYPEYIDPNFTATGLLKQDSSVKMESLRATVQKTDQGMRIYVANPVYTGTELQGLVVAYFDPQALLLSSQAPETFSIITPTKVLWAGAPHLASLTNFDWEKHLREEASGVVELNNRDFYWVNRYLGTLPLIYVIPVDAKMPVTQAK